MEGFKNFLKIVVYSLVMVILVVILFDSCSDKNIASGDMLTLVSRGDRVASTVMLKPTITVKDTGAPWTPEPTWTVQPTWTPEPTWTAQPQSTQPPAPTWTPEPTWTSEPTWTPAPEYTPTPTPFSEISDCTGATTIYLANEYVIAVNEILLADEFAMASGIPLEKFMGLEHRLNSAPDEPCQESLLRATNRAYAALAVIIANGFSYSSSEEAEYNDAMQNFMTEFVNATGHSPSFVERTNG